MPLEIHRQSVVGQRGGKPRSIDLRRLPFRARATQPPPPLTSHLTKPPLTDIVAGGRAASCIADALHRRRYRLAVAKNESRQVLDLGTLVRQPVGVPQARVDFRFRQVR